MNKAQQKRFQSLYKKHVNALRRQGKSKSTIDIYSRAVRRVTLFFDRCPDRLTVDDLKDYFSSLVKTHSWSTVKVDRNGLQFFYKHVLGKEWKWVDIVKPPVVKTLPDILTHKELTRLINSAKELRYQAFILCIYSTGMRLGEALNLKVGDIDATRRRLHIRNAKGGKDRYITLPKAALYALRLYWATHRNPQWLFPLGKQSDERRLGKRPMNRGGLQKAFQLIVKDAGIKKKVTIHSLRHCYGAHLLEGGASLRAIQQEMGHESPKTTAIYTQLTQVSEQKTEDIINAMIDLLTIDLIKGGE